MTKVKFKRNWRNPDWVIKSMIYSPISREELKALKTYWFYQWNFVESSNRNKNAYDSLVQIWELRNGKKRELHENAGDELAAILADEINKEVLAEVTKHLNEL